VRYASINVFTVRAGDMDTFVALQRDAFVPLLRQQPGFLAFELVRTGDDTGVAMLWWASEDARHAATPCLTAWVEQHLMPFFVTLDNPAGPVVVASHDQDHP
jgi:quinol monooxygenase YgiN